MLKKFLRIVSTSLYSVLTVFSVSVMRSRQSFSSFSGVPSSFSFFPYRWIFSQLSLTLFRPNVAEEPFRKWPSLDSSSRSLASLVARQQWLVMHARRCHLNRGCRRERRRKRRRNMLATAMVAAGAAGHSECACVCARARAQGGRGEWGPWRCRRMGGTHRA